MANASSFHYHGNNRHFPLTSAIVVPNDKKSEAILLGRYQENAQGQQLIRPSMVIQELVQSIFRIKKMLDSVVLTVIMSTLLTILLVFLLSIRLREKELKTIFRLGCSRLAISGFIMAEIAIIAVISFMICGCLLYLTSNNSHLILIKLLG